MLRKMISVSGVLLAPVTYVLGRSLGSSSLSSRSVNFDHDYMRGYASALQAKDIESDMFVRFSQAAKLCASWDRNVDLEMLKLFPSSHGQLLQDVMCALVHGGKRDGYFVEIGVGDGEKFSNTLLLERDFGWRGILAEPAKMFHENISDTRSSILDKRAVSNESGKTVLFEQDDGMGELSGLAGQRSPRGRQSLSTYEVSTVRLDDLLAEYNAPDEIDYMSIDTEGSETSVLEGLSLSKRRISLLTIEHNYDQNRMRAYADLFEPAGYRRLFPNLSSFDYWYIHKDIEF